MSSINANKKFLEVYEKLKTVSLNPERHLAKNAFEHTEMVVKRSVQLAKLNNFSDDEIKTITNLSYRRTN